MERLVMISCPAFDGVMTKCCNAARWIAYNPKRETSCITCNKNEPELIPYKLNLYPNEKTSDQTKTNDQTT